MLNPLSMADQKNKYAVEMGRLGGIKGGNIRTGKLTPERRSEIAKIAAERRWGSAKRAAIEVGLRAPEVLPPTADRTARFSGQLFLGDVPVDCYVLSTEERVLSLSAAVRAIAEKDRGGLADYIKSNAISPFINKDLVAAQNIEFSIPGNPNLAKGIRAETFLEICTAYVNALKAGALRTARQREIAIRCSILLASCAKIGLIALIDEATGYQYERPSDALQVKLHAFIADELREWEKTFPDELWEEFGRLTSWKGALHSRPKWWGKLVMELIYQALDPDVAEYLKNHKPKPQAGRNYHQWMTQDVGLKALIPHIYKVIGIAKTCRDIRQLRDRVALNFTQKHVQLSFDA